MPPATLIGQRFAIHPGLRVDPSGPAGAATEPRGVILGSVVLCDVVDNSRSRWPLPDCWHWILSDPIALKHPIPHADGSGFDSETPQNNDQPQSTRSKIRRAKVQVRSLIYNTATNEPARAHNPKGAGQVEQSTSRRRRRCGWEAVWRSSGDVPHRGLTARVLGQEWAIHFWPRPD
jgi:hypothetical protein